MAVQNNIGKELEWLNIKFGDINSKNALKEIENIVININSTD